MTIEYLVWHRESDRPCVRDDDRELTYAEFARRVDGFAAQLQQHGIAAGDVVAVMLPNRAELLVALMAAWRLGATATPVNPAFTATEAEYQIDDAGAVLVLGAGPDTPSGGRPLIHVDDMATAPPAGWSAGADPRPDDTALLIYTSGSTGRPKGVQLAHANLQFMADSFRTHLQLTEADHCLLILPLFHVNAIAVSFLAPILAGAQLSITGRFSPARFFDDVARLRPTYFSAVPTIYALLVSQPLDTPVDTSSLRFAICGAAPISKELLDRVEQRFGLVVVEGYGLTEGTCASACNPIDGPRKLGTVGPALPGQQIAIAGPDGRHLPAGATGEVLIKGPNVMRGYLGRPEETARTVVDGWLHTGDVGRLDEDGYLTLVDRIKDMIIRGGENLYPKEIENALATHPAVLESAVIGAPHEVYGEVPVAYVVTYPERTVTDSELLAHLSERLTRVKVPAEVHVVAALPRNPVGKIDKPGLRRSHGAPVHA
ncbi:MULTISPECIES: class I adenylate-forming enzyme family protein [Rhodococcus]|uniref:class I adenylate-forming enzyme family protein n=1 Tax=Rhodococcus TaxID=1827 RepID=UPI000C9B56A3|nr:MULTISPECIES: AMP-binding protein [Rhodococcus]PND50161.1 AMP-dependent synthetase [Rhodococcus sp. ENV425]USC15302.1 AMP-binding protein [Rhodococcus sp. 11-3]WKW98677.1 AMP-binding protein [Rhodococcus aetherivorans]